MSRGDRRGGRSSRGGFSAGNLPPMGLTFADIQNMSREAGELYPVSVAMDSKSCFWSYEKAAE